MPGPKGETSGDSFSPATGAVESPSPDTVTYPQGSPPLRIPPDNSRAVRINAKRKPDKSKIFRIRTNESGIELQQLICSGCQGQFQTKEELDDHQEFCLKESRTSESSTGNREPRHPDDLRRHQDEANNNNEANLNRKSPSRSFSPQSRSSSVDRSTNFEGDDNQENDPLSQVRQLLQQSSSSQVPIAQQLAQSNMALEAIQNTRMALAQLASNALGNGQPVSPQVMQEMAVLQSTLYTLQHQQMMQLQLIQQLQAQLSIKNKDNEHTTEDKNEEDEELREERVEMRDDETSPSSSNIADKPLPDALNNSFINSFMERFKPPKDALTNEKSIPNLASSLSTSNESRDRAASPPMTSSNIASAVIQHSDPPPSDEPNTLEMLQRTANQVLSNASHGLLTNRLIDDYNKPPDGKDTYYKHRCRYCGKVFGSDSALQIHVRSHTGERPFKCNICGNRFTTKGNLKVHFQRHSSRFPHVKMNPHPVPEHLDKLHPPLLAQLGELKDYPPPPTGPPNPFGTSPVAPSLPPFRLHPPHPPPLDLNKPFNPTELVRREMPTLEMEEPENFSSTRNSFDSDDEQRNGSEMEVDPSSPGKDPKENENNSDTVKDFLNSEQSNDHVKEPFHYVKTPTFRDPLQEVLKNTMKEPMLSEKLKESLRNSIHNHIHESYKESVKERLEEAIPIDHQIDRTQLQKGMSNLFKEPIPESLNDASRGSQNDISKDSNSERMTNKERDTDSCTPMDIRIKADQELKDTSDHDKKAKEDMDTDSNDSRSLTSDQPTDLRIRPDFRPFGFPNVQFSGHPLPFPFLPGFSPPFLPSSAPPTSGPLVPNVDLTKDPNLYANLLPRPGSTDNSWEALIEVEKTSETMKLEHLVNNIEHKLSDPNQCVICHRVLSCKSALQMHYRTHTGERPFKCKICGRAFTTKGNLKTHMGVHRAKPPLRMLHQCPVCHKKFTNSLVLQQHIRLHTGEPTDLTPEQIAAAEVREFPPTLPIQTSLPPVMPGGFPLHSQPLHGFPPIPLHLRYQLSPEMLRRYEMDSDERKEEEEKYLRLMNSSPRSSSTSSAEQRIAEDLSVRLKGENNVNGASSPHHSVSPTPSDYSDLDDKLQDTQNDHQNSLMDRFISPSISQAMVTMAQENIVSSAPLDLAARPPPLFSHFGLFPPQLSVPQSSPGTQTLPSMSPLYMPNMPGRGSTTCQVCFKSFACQSALEIHYRSHTKERPFKCVVCDRGFSTKGNMKQHMLTHKMRDGIAGDEASHSCGKKGLGPTPPFGKDETSNDAASKRDDAGIKREREGELLLPVSKRSSGPADELQGSEDSPPDDEPPVLSPIDPTPRSYTPPQGDTSTPILHHTPQEANSTPILRHTPQEANSTSLLHHNPLPPHFNIPTSLHHHNTISISASLPLPPSLSLPSSLSFSSPLSVPLAPPPLGGLASSQPLPHS